MKDSIHILVVDDEELNFFLVNMIINKLNSSCIVSHVSSGEEALQILKNSKFRLILVDVNLPGISGYKTCETIRLSENRNKEYTPIIAMSANSLNEMQAKGNEVGIDDYLVKPIQTEAMRMMLNKYLKI